MIRCNDWPIGVCAWSLGNDFDKINQLRDDTGLSCLHLDVTPGLAKGGESYLSRVEKEGWQVTAMAIMFPHEDYTTMETIKVTGGIVPDEHWENSKKMTFDSIDIAAGMGVDYVTFHFGFLDLSDKAYNAKLLDRAKAIADRASKKGVEVLMETGQESAAELKQFLEELKCPAMGVNFDPANMIAYDKGDPIESVHTLAAYIRHVHIKDALHVKVPGEFGEEVPWGDGDVGPGRFLEALKQIKFSGVLAIEREAGDERMRDIKTAIERLTKCSG